ncbi:MAG: ornithine cyclodeaminase family protein [Candidatus Binatia bacterium]
MRQNGVVYLSNQDVKKLLDLKTAIEITAGALRDHHEGRVVWSKPEDLAIKPEHGWQYWVTGCALGEQSVAGFRVRAIKAEGGSRDLSKQPRGPRRILILSDREGGEIIAIMDEDWCHSVRTAAAATVACRVLARKDSTKLALLGAGDTARATLPVMAKGFNLEDVRVTSRSPESRRSFARELSAELHLQIRPIDTTEEALAGADMVISATTTTKPFIQEAWLGKGIFVYSIGKHQELENAAYKNVDKFVVDSWEHCKKKSDLDRMLREGFLTEKDVYAELPELIAGSKPGRESDRERIFMRAIGLVNQDIAIAHWLYRRALETGAGTLLPY